jgi:hypothetical protein
LLYRELLDTLADDVRNHLRLAAQALADLRAGRGSDSAGRTARSQRSGPWQKA